MSVSQVLEEVEGFSSSQIQELIDALREVQHKTTGENQSVYATDAQVFFNEPIILSAGTPTLREMLEAKDS